MNEQTPLDDATEAGLDQPRLGEIGLNSFAPYLMNRIMGRYNASLREEMAALGLSTPQMRALAVLSVIDGIQIKQLAVYAVVEQSTLSRALDVLAADGLVRRVADPADSRATLIQITDAGRAAFETLWPRMAQSYARMFRGIAPGERATFVATLQKILANIRKHEF
ncbi:MarR family transcriptional regulator [Fertoebacter nigrum]|uniref:MarR family transcriptional regulator n=1 Tax=Fertoeibacter niger TaxID=2656921 RepID=A0A8X8GY87_9RHOB|nr:MarR family transcriptional regulator [Fertoeibacter niger]NUB43616.1 MarR family transcriptional regulator [Fertoeibacter niger]